MNLPTFCACGRTVRYANEARCEDCWVLDQVKYHGKSRAVSTIVLGPGEVMNVPVQIKTVVAGGY